MAATPVTNAEFERLIADTGYRTDAARYGSSVLFTSFLLRDTVDVHPGAPWWAQVHGDRR
ncbi:MAG: formylglycine-generating enzyme family protein [Acidimicrobiia bacterium]|nr:formylglycine-generating enzyme family protein [Acidimicrobiia bacterium]